MLPSYRLGIITGRNEVVAKVMFLLMSVILSMGGGCLLQEVSALGGVCSRGCLLSGGVCSQGVSAPGGCLLGGCLLGGGSAGGGVFAPGGCLLRGRGCLLPGGCIFISYPIIGPVVRQVFHLREY